MRNRSITIDAETEEEFINLYENHRSRLSKKILILITQMMKMMNIIIYLLIK